MGAYLVKLLFWWGMSIVKFLFTPSAMMASRSAPDSRLGGDWSFLEIALISASGAALGVFIFYLFGERLFNHLDRHRKKPPKRFSRSTRFIARVRGKFGLFGLLLICGLISVPVSSLLAARYYQSPTTMPLLIAAFVVWSFLLTALSFVVSLAF